jgi:glucose-6-phosphate isomerase
MLTVSLFQDKPKSSGLLAAFTDAAVLQKLKALDTKAHKKGIGALNPKDLLTAIGTEHRDGVVTKNSYGVFNLSWQAEKRLDEWTRAVQEEAEAIRTGIRATHGKKLRFVIWAGMGGSAEDKSAYLACGLLQKGPKLFVLDSTDPAKLKAILAEMEQRAGSLAEALRTTLVVGMAMGMTSYEPVVNLTKIAALYDLHQIDSTPNICYLTLPGSLLDQFAGPRGYRRIELQLDGGNSTAGRHSSPLTKGSLLPLALAGVDLKAWFRGTFLPEKDVLACWKLAAFLESQGREGRDKVTLILPKEWRGASIWTKQDFEESLGKSEERGLKIIVDEPLKRKHYRDPKDPKQDRVFLSIERKGAPRNAKAEELRAAGYPFAAFNIEAAAPLSRYMQAMHYVVFGLGYLRKMNFVTQPSVELYKSITSSIVADAEASGGIEKTAEWKQAAEQRLTPEEYVKRLAAALEAGAAYGELTFFGDLRYTGSGKAMRKSLEKAGSLLFRDALRMPVDIHEGPAMNHSYHEMIIGHGRCFTTVILSEQAESILEAGYTAEYHRAQFLATRRALENRGRFVVPLLVKDLGAESLQELEEFFAKAARLLA